MMFEKMLVVCVVLCVLVFSSTLKAAFNKQAVKLVLYSTPRHAAHTCPCFCKSTLSFFTKAQPRICTQIEIFT